MINRKLHVYLCTQLYHFVLISSLIKFVSTGGNVISVVFLKRYFEIQNFFCLENMSSSPRVPNVLIISSRVKMAILSY